MKTLDLDSPSTRHAGSTSRGRRFREDAARDAERWARDRGDYTGSRVAGSAWDDRDLTEPELIRARRASRRAYKTSGIFGAMVDQAVCHVIGDGVSIEGDEEEATAYVLGVLNHPRNAFLDGIDETFRRWIVDGEGVLTLRVPTRDGKTPTGDVWIGAMDPNALAGFRVDPWNDQRVMELKLPVPKAPDNAKGPRQDPTQWIPVADVDEEKVTVPGWPIPRWDPKGGAIAPTTGSQTLHVQYLRLNALGSRGAPLFSRSVDKVKLLDLLVDHLMAKAEYTNRHWLHITYKPKDSGGKNDRAFEKRMIRWASDGQPGDVAVTSDDVKVQVLAPDLKLIDQKALYEISVGYILGSHSMPRVWFGESAGERAGAAEAGTPIFRLLKWLQGRLKRAIEELVRFLVAIGRASSKIKKPGATFTIALAEFATRDSVRDVQELTWATQGLDAALTRRAISPAEYQRMIRRIIASKPFGGELDDEAPELDDPNAPVGGVGADAEALLHGRGPEADAPKAGERPGAGGSSPSGAPAAPSVPASTGAGPVGGAGGDLQKTALNGAQIQAVMDVCTQVAEGLLPAAVAKAILALAFPGYDLEQIGSAVDAAAAEGETRKTQRAAAEAAAAKRPPPGQAPEEPDATDPVP